MNLTDTCYGKILTSPSIDEIIRWVESTPSHFFEASTMRWFGTRRSSLAVIDRMVVIGKDGKAPQGYPPYWARVFTEDGDVEKVGSALTRRAIVTIAHEVARSLSEVSA